MGLADVHRVPGRVGAQRGAPLDGITISAQLRALAATRVRERALAGRRAPVLATVLVGQDPSIQAYVDAKHHACTEVGILSFDHRLAADTSAAELEQVIRSLNGNTTVDGILLQLPLPTGLDPLALTNLIAPEKDVDGLTTTNTGALWRGDDGLPPCTPLGVIELLERSRVPLASRHVVIIGRSNLIAKPLAAMLLAREATVTICDAKTRFLKEICRHAQILVIAAGTPSAIGAAHVSPGTVVIDIGAVRTHEGPNEALDFAAVRPLASASTPVPGGVGPMTIACLLLNTLKAAEISERKRERG